MAINFNNIGVFKGVEGGPNVLSNPTSLQFGPDGRLYVSEQNGSINAFTVTIEGGQYIAVAHEELMLPNGQGVVKGLQNHNDDGSLSGQSNRQVTGLLVTEDEAGNVVLYISSSDPRISSNGEVNLDTNSGVVTRVTQTETGWESVDIIRGLPRSEENHATNGLALSQDGTKLYVQNGGNTNNGAPSQFFSYTAEYTLSGTLLEIDLVDIESRPILVDPAGGQGGQPRSYIYDLPTLDDPSVANDGARENAAGLDVNGPWGGNDGFNQAVLPADAPLRIYADGFRNQYDIVVRSDGKLFTVDNGSNGNLGGNPVTDGGEPTNTPNNGGLGDPEPLFYIVDGGYYGHPAPVRANQDLEWTIFNDSGDPDGSVTPNTVPDLSALVPDSLAIADGFVIDPSKFTGDPTRLAESGVRVERSSNDSNALATLGSSSNGLVEYDSNGQAFGGALDGMLLVTQFNGNVTLLNPNDAGTGMDPILDDVGAVLSANGVLQLNGFGVTDLGAPLDVTVGPDGTIWVAEIGANEVSVYAPSDLVLPDDPDFDNDGIDNAVDPFTRDATNGGLVTVTPGQDLLWSFAASGVGDDTPGPEGYGGGLTGVMIDGQTDFEQFFQAPSDLPNQDVNLDNVKFTTAAGGGATVVEFVSNGDPFQASNSGEFLFHTGATISPLVDTFTVTWSMFNPGDALKGEFQQIGGYIGTGDQSNYLKVVAIQNANGEVQMLLEDGDVASAATTQFLQADDLFSVPEDDAKKIFLSVTIDKNAATATPSITYETAAGATTTVDGTPMSIAGSTVMDVINGGYSVQGQTTGLAVGLLSSNTGQDAADTFQAVFDDISITATGEAPTTEVVYRVNAGGLQIAATDGGPDWSADTATNNSQFLAVAGSNNTTGFAVAPGATVAPGTPAGIFQTERWDAPAAPEMQWAFDVSAGLYEVRLFMGNGFGGTSAPGQRVFDVSIEGQVPPNLDDVDLSADFGHTVGGMISNLVTVNDGTLNIEFIHGVENPLINGIEIIQIFDSDPVDSVNGVPVAGDDFSTDPAAPTQIALAAGGQTTVRSLLEGENQDRDFFTVSIPDGHRLTDVLLSDYSADLGNLGFIGLVAGDDFILNPPIPPAGDEPASNPDGQVDPGDLLGGYVFGDGDVGDDLLPKLNNISAGFAGFDEDALTGELTFWLNQGGGASDATLVFVTEEIPTPSNILYRVNTGGAEVAATDGGPAWSEDSQQNNSPFLTNPGSNNDFPTNGAPGATPIDTSMLGGLSAPQGVLGVERFDTLADENGAMAYSFAVEAGQEVEVRLYLAELFADLPDLNGDGAPTGDRIFDVSVDGVAPADFQGIDPYALAGDFNKASVVTHTLVSDGSVDLEFIHVSQNPAIKGIEIVAVGDPTGGSAFLTVNNNSNNIQISNFGNGSFVLTNNGDKDIASVVIDVENALYPDSVFDPFGVAGDTVAKQMTISGGSQTGVVVLPGGSDGYYIGAGGVLGYEGVQLTFDSSVDGGFNPGESVAFAVDMDPNSIAGALKSTLDPGADPTWDIGGVSGAELIGSSFTVTFTDGSTATGQLQGQINGSGTELQGGSQGLASQDAPDLSVDLTVNGLAPGSVGTYNDGGPTVSISGPAGQIARVVLTQGFIQPGENNFPDTADPNEFHDQLDAQLAALSASDFPANNAVDFQIVDVALTGGPQDITNLFDFSQVLNGGPLGGGGWNDDVAGELPLGFVASVIDPNAGANGAPSGLPIGPVTDPIYLQHTEVLPADLSLSKTASATTPAVGDTVTFTLTVANDGSGDATGVAVEDILSAGFAFEGATASSGAYDPETGLWTIGAVANGGTETLEITATVLDTTPETVKTPLFRVNVGGPQLAAADGSAEPWAADQGNFGSPNNNNNPNLVANSTGNSIFNGNSNSAHPGPINVSDPSVPASAPTAVFNTERFDAASDPEMKWEFDVASGVEIEVTLLFAELFGQIDMAGERVFDVKIEDVEVFSDVDPFAVAGAKGAFALTHTLTVLDDVLDIEFIHDVENPALKGIEINRLDAGEAPVDAYDNYAQIVASDQADPDSTPGDGSVGDDDDASVSLTPVTTTDLSLSKAVSDETPAFGDQVAFTLTVTHEAGLDATGVEVSDLLPDGFTYVSDNGGGTYDAGTGLWSVGSIAAGETATLEIVAAVNSTDAPPTETVLFRVNNGGPEIAAAAGDPSGVAWAEDRNPTANNPEFTPSSFRTEGGQNTFTLGNAGRQNNFTTNDSVSSLVPTSVFFTERWDPLSGQSPEEMSWAFPVTSGDDIEVRLYFAEIFNGITAGGARVFDIEVEGVVPAAFDDVDPFGDGGGLDSGFMVSHTLTMTDDSLDLTFLRNVENPAVKAIEIIQLTPSDPLALDFLNTAQIVAVDQPDADAGNDSASVEVQASQVGQNTLSIAAVQDAAEPATNGQFLVSLEEAASVSTTVSYTVSGSAEAESDFVALSGTVEIAQGAASATIDVTVIDDFAIEGLEDVTVTLTAVSGDPAAAIGATDAATIALADDDVPNEVTIAPAANAAEPETDGQFLVSLDQIAATDTTVTYTVSGTAAAESDYVALSGSVIIPAGSLSAPIDVAVLDDAELEGVESVIVTLDSATGDANVAIGAANAATVEIADDDLSLGATIVVSGVTTFGTTALQITNTSDAGVKIVGVDFDIGTATMSLGLDLDGEFLGAVWDPTAEAGDAGGQGILVNPGVGNVVGFVDANGAVVAPGAEISTSPYPFDNQLLGPAGPAGTPGGFQFMNLDFTDFDPGELFQFGIDVDPQSIQNAFGTGQAGAVSGAEIAGTTISITFEGPSGEQTTVTRQLEATDFISSSAVFSGDAAQAAPELNVIGVTNNAVRRAETSDTTHTVTVSEVNPGDVVELFVFDASGYVKDGGDGTEALPPDLFHANQLDVAPLILQATADANGIATFQIDIGSGVAGAAPATVDDLFFLSAGVVDANGDLVSLMSQPAQLKLVDPPSSGFVADFESGADDFVYVDDAFGTNEPAYASGSQADGLLKVDLGGVDNSTVLDMSGGWTRSFTTVAGQTAELTVNARLELADNVDAGEFIQLVASIDDGPLQVIATLEGDAPFNNPNYEIDFQDYVVDFGELSAGEHTLTVGAFMNKKTKGNEDGEVEIDFISLALSGDPANTVNVGVAQNAAEPDQNGQFLLALDQIALTDTVVTYQVAGTAANGTDYAALTGTATIPAGSLTAPIVVEPIDDTAQEGDETVQITLLSAAGDPDVVLGASTSATVVIAENDFPNLVTIAPDGDAAEPDQDGAFLVSLERTAATDTTVTYQVAGSADNGIDYTTLTLTAVIPAGSLSTPITIETIDDGDDEGAETVQVTLLSAAGDADVALGSAVSATVTIADDDAPNIVAIQPVANGAEPDTDGQFVVTLDQAAATDTVLSYAVSGDATSGVDYAALTGQVTIPAGALSAPIDVEVLDDAEDEPLEDVSITLTGVDSGDANVAIGASSSASITIAGGETPPPTGFLATFDSGAEGFVYSDDAFGTNQPDYAEGKAEDGALEIELGGVDNDDISGMSGGWSTTFESIAGQQGRLTIDGVLELTDNVDEGEFIQLLVAVDGDVIGPVAQLEGGPEFNVPDYVLELNNVEVDLGELEAGEHTLTIGVFMNEKTKRNEEGDFILDTLELELSDAGGVF